MREIRSFGVFGVANVGALRASLMRFVRSQRIDCMDQRRGPKPACPDKVRHLDDYGAACALNYGSTTGYQAGVSYVDHVLCGSYDIYVRH